MIHTLPGILNQQGAAAGGPLWVADFSGTGAYSDADTNLLAGTVARVSDRLEGSVNYSTNTLEIDGPTYTDFQWIKVTIEQGTPGANGFLAINQTLSGAWGPLDAGNGYSVQILPEGNTGNVEVRRNATLVANLGDGAWTAGDELYLLCEENGTSVDISYWVAGSQVGSTYTDSSPLTGGHPAFGWYTYETNYSLHSAASTGDDENL